MTYLPTENHPVWSKLLRDQIHLKTNLLPLKLLLSKLKLDSVKVQEDRLIDNIIELRDFFIANSQNLEKEIDQLCGIEGDRKSGGKRTAPVSRTKLVLPSVRNPIWVEILTGQVALNSKSVPLNLLISHQKSVFLLSHDNIGKRKSSVGFAGLFS